MAKQKHNNHMTTGVPVAKMLMKAILTDKGFSKMEFDKEWEAKITRAALDFFHLNPALCTEEHIIKIAVRVDTHDDYENLPGFEIFDQVLTDFYEHEPTEDVHN